MIKSSHYVHRTCNTKLKSNRQKSREGKGHETRYECDLR
jgi:hypothetical protein